MANTPNVSPRLPLEVIQEIINFLPGADLKIIRLTCHEFKRMSEPHLFRRIVLLPSSQCLESFCEIFDNKSARLSERFQTRFLIRELVYDDRWLPTAESLRSKIKAMKKDQDFNASTRNRTLKTLDAFKATYFTLKDDDAFEVALLARVFQLLSIETLHIIDEQQDERLPPDEIPCYLLRICERPRSLREPQTFCAANLFSRNPAYYSRVFKILSAMYAAHKICDNIKASNLHWHSFLRANLSSKSVTIVRSQLERLDSFDLSWHCRKRQSVFINTNYLTRVHEILRMTKNLQTLRVRLSSRPLCELENEITYEDSYLGPLLEGPDGHCLFRLRRVYLDSFVTFENELLKFIQNHRKLRVVGLRNILLLRESSDTPRGCFVRIIKCLASHGRLEKVEFGGYLSNGGNQLWYPHPVPAVTPFEQQRVSLKCRIEAYVTNQTAILPPELERNSVTHPHNDVLPPSIACPWVKGDCTWSMTQRVSPPPDEVFLEHPDSDELDWAPPPPPPSMPVPEIGQPLPPVQIPTPPGWSFTVPTLPPPLPLPIISAPSTIPSSAASHSHSLPPHLPIEVDYSGVYSDESSWGDGNIIVEAGAQSDGSGNPSPSTSTSANSGLTEDSGDILENFDFDACLNQTNCILASEDLCSQSSVAESKASATEHEKGGKEKTDNQTTSAAEEDSDTPHSSDPDVPPRSPELHKFPDEVADGPHAPLSPGESNRGKTKSSVTF